MHHAYIIECGETAVGLVTREDRGFVFHAASAACQALDGQMFPTVAKAERAVAALRQARLSRTERRAPARGRAARKVG